MKNKRTFKDYILYIVFFFAGIGIGLYLNFKDVAIFYQIPFYGLALLGVAIILYYLFTNNNHSHARSLKYELSSNKDQAIMIFFYFFILIVVFLVKTADHTLARYILRMIIMISAFFINHYAYDDSLTQYLSDLKEPGISDVSSLSKDLQIEYATKVVGPCGVCYRALQQIKQRLLNNHSSKYNCVFIAGLGNLYFLDKGSPYYNRFSSALVTYSILAIGYFLTLFIYNKTWMHIRFEMFKMEGENNHIYYDFNNKYKLNVLDYKNNMILEEYSGLIENNIDSLMLRFSMRRIVMIVAVAGFLLTI